MGATAVSTVRDAPISDHRRGVDADGEAPFFQFSFGLAEGGSNTLPARGPDRVAGLSGQNGRT
jgi:hypothetical protein